MPHSWHHFAFETMECDCILEYPISLAIKQKVDDTRRHKTPPKSNKVRPHPPHLHGWHEKHMQVRHPDYGKAGHLWRNECRWLEPQIVEKRRKKWGEYLIKVGLYEWETGEDWVDRKKRPKGGDA